MVASHTLEAIPASDSSTGFGSACLGLILQIYTARAARCLAFLAADPYSDSAVFATGFQSQKTRCIWKMIVLYLRHLTTLNNWLLHLLILSFMTISYKIMSFLRVDNLTCITLILKWKVRHVHIGIVSPLSFGVQSSSLCRLSPRNVLRATFVLECWFPCRGVAFSLDWLTRFASWGESSRHGRGSHGKPLLPGLARALRRCVSLGSGARWANSPSQRKHHIDVRNSQNDEDWRLNSKFHIVRRESCTSVTQTSCISLHFDKQVVE